MINLSSEYLSIRCIWLYVLVMCRTLSWVNPHSIVAWMSRNSFLKACVKAEVSVAAFWLEPRTIWFVNEHSTIWPNWSNDWAVFGVLICTGLSTVCSCHLTYAIQSESTLYSCLNIKSFFSWSERVMWCLSDCNWTWSQNQLVRKRTLNHLAELAKWLSCVLSTYLYGTFDRMFLPYHVNVSEWLSLL